MLGFIIFNFWPAIRIQYYLSDKKQRTNIEFSVFIYGSGASAKASSYPDSALNPGPWLRVKLNGLYKKKHVNLIFVFVIISVFFLNLYVFFIILIRR